MRAIFVSILFLSAILQTIPLVEAGVPDSVTVFSDSDSASVDGAIQFTAEVRDSSGVLLDDDVIWSVSNGTITSDGITHTPNHIIIEQNSARITNFGSKLNRTID
jgi:hypothetical protein